MWRKLGDDGASIYIGMIAIMMDEMTMGMKRKETSKRASELSLYSILDGMAMVFSFFPTILFFT